MNNLWGKGSDINNNNNSNNIMKLVFVNNTEKEKITNLVTNASSISNSRSLMDLVEDSVVEGSVPEPIEEKEKSTPDVPVQETMKDLIARAESFGIRVNSEASRAGILKAIKELEDESSEVLEEIVEDETKDDSSSNEDKKDEVVKKSYKVLNKGGIQVKEIQEVLEEDAVYEANPESEETKKFLEVGAIEEII